MNEIWVRVRNKEQLEAAAAEPVISHMIAEATAAENTEDFQVPDKKLILSLPDVAREAKLERLERLEKLCGFSNRFSGVCIKNIDETGLLKESGYEGYVVADPFLYTYNEQAVSFYRSVFESIDFMASQELTLKELKSLEAKADVRFIYKAYGYQQLMITAQCMNGAYYNCKEPVLELKDEAGGCFSVTSECRYGYDTVYNGYPTFMLDKIADFGEDARILLDFTTESKEEVLDVLKLAKQAVAQKDHICEMPEKFTRGHYYTGIE